MTTSKLTFSTNEIAAASTLFSEAMSAFDGWAQYGIETVDPLPMYMDNVVIAIRSMLPREQHQVHKLLELKMAKVEGYDWCDHHDGSDGLSPLQAFNVSAWFAEAVLDYDNPAEFAEQVA